MPGRIDVVWWKNPWTYRAKCTTCGWVARSFRFNITTAQRDSRQHGRACA